MRPPPDQAAVYPPKAFKAAGPKPSLPAPPGGGGGSGAAGAVGGAPRFCYQCGSGLLSGSKFCSNCGTPVADLRQSNPGSSSKQPGGKVDNTSPPPSRPGPAVGGSRLAVSPLKGPGHAPGMTPGMTPGPLASPARGGVDHLESLAAPGLGFLGGFHGIDSHLTQEPSLNSSLAPGPPGRPPGGFGHLNGGGGLGGGGPGFWGHAAEGPAMPPPAPMQAADLEGVEQVDDADLESRLPFFQMLHGVDPPGEDSVTRTLASFLQSPGTGPQR
mmetsp:Transcript_55206/g.125526  ORF Transcript_55206/g.125526 Transcript_55206/m.125526 type:complete len:271 (-) Transcript_55206:348-1160(-)